MRTKLSQVPLVPYTKREERLNTATHAAGLVLCVLIAVRCVRPAFLSKDPLSVVSSLFYLYGTAFTFTASAVYHGLPAGLAKRVFRLLDHCAIFFAVAGTATGCLPAVYKTIGLTPTVLMGVAAWTGADLGLFFTVRDFNGSGVIRMVCYIVTGAIAAIAGAGAYGHLPRGALWALLGGSALLLTGAALCGVGKKIRYVHCLFHLFVDAGLTVYFLGIQAYCY